MTYFRAVDPYPLESRDWNALHEFYERLGAGTLATTVCDGCGRRAWPPRGFCPECGSDRYRWVDLPDDGVIHAFTVQETGLPPGFAGPRVFVVVKIGELRIFSILLDTDPAATSIGQRVRLAPLRIADDPRGAPRWLPAFRVIP